RPGNGSSSRASSSPRIHEACGPCASVQVFPLSRNVHLPPSPPEISDQMPGGFVVDVQTPEPESPACKSVPFVAVYFTVAPPPPVVVFGELGLVTRTVPK